MFQATTEPINTLILRKESCSYLHFAVPKMLSLGDDFDKYTPCIEMYTLIYECLGPAGNDLYVYKFKGAEK